MGENRRGKFEESKSDLKGNFDKQKEYFSERKYFCNDRKKIVQSLQRVGNAGLKEVKTGESFKDWPKSSCIEKVRIESILSEIKLASERQSVDQMEDSESQSQFRLTTKRTGINRLFLGNQMRRRNVRSERNEKFRSM